MESNAGQVLFPRRRLGSDMLTVTQEGASLLWQQILGLGSIGAPWVHLFVAPYVPQHADTYATYAALEVPLGNGYAPIQLTPPAVNWSIAPIGAGAQAQYQTIMWAFTAGTTVRGYWIADSTNSYSLWAENWGNPQFYPAAGGLLVMQPLAWLASFPDVAGVPCTSP